MVGRIGSWLLILCVCVCLCMSVIVNVCVKTSKRGREKVSSGSSRCKWNNWLVKKIKVSLSKEWVYMRNKVERWLKNLRSFDELFSFQFFQSKFFRAQPKCWEILAQKPWWLSLCSRFYYSSFELTCNYSFLEIKKRPKVGRGIYWWVA